MVLNLDTIAISHQIKYYLTTNRVNFLEMQYGSFLDLQVCFACRFNGLLLKKYLPRTQEKLERDFLEDQCKRSLKFCDWSSTQVSLFLLTGETEIVNFQGCDMHWYLS